MTARQRALPGEDLEASPVKELSCSISLSRILLLEADGKFGNSRLWGYLLISMEFSLSLVLLCNY